MKVVSVLVLLSAMIYVSLGQFGGNSWSFGEYNCATSKIAVTQPLQAAAGMYGITSKVVGSTSYQIQVSFNVTGGTFNTNALTFYYTVYGDQVLNLFNLANSTIIVNDTIRTPCVNATLGNVGDEATRVFNIDRQSQSRGIGSTVLLAYRNPYLDLAAQNLLVNPDKLVVPTAYNTAPNTTSVSFIASNLGSLVNPGAIVEKIVQSTIYTQSKSTREMGVAFSASLAKMAFVFASRPIACGNGLVDGSDENCDDGNTVSGDGCSSGCRVENNYNCNQNIFNETSVCTLVAGASASASPAASATNSVGASQTASISSTKSAIAPSSTPSVSQSPVNIPVSLGVSIKGSPSSSPVSGSSNPQSASILRPTNGPPSSASATPSQTSQGAPASQSSLVPFQSASSQPSFTSAPSESSSFGASLPVGTSESASPNAGSVVGESESESYSPYPSYAVYTAGTSTLSSWVSLF